MSGPIDLGGALKRIEADHPLVNAITNTVTINDVANIIRYWDGLPVMYESRGGLAELFGVADGCLLNTGTVTSNREQLFFDAGHTAAAADVPVIVDPVGAGATDERTVLCRELVEQVDVSVINGNYGEIAALAGEDSEVKGVEAIGEYSDIATTAIGLAQEMDTIVVASGATDIVADATTAYAVDAGDPMLAEFVGSGCMLGATVALFVAATDDPLAGALAGVTGFGIAGERTASSDRWHGAESYRMAFLDTISTLDRTAIDTDETTARITTAATV